MRRIVIFGAGGFAREVAMLLDQVNRVAPQWSIVGYLVDREHHVEDARLRLGVHFSDTMRVDPEMNVVVAIGSPSARRAVVGRLREAGWSRFPALVHPSACIGSDIDLPNGTVVTAGAVITTDITLGEHVHVDRRSTIGHDSRIGSFVTLSPGVNVSGNVSLGDETDVGTGASFIPGVTVGERCVIGAGAVVTRDIPARSLAVGVPARVVRTQQL